MTEVNFNTKIARQRGKHLSKEGVKRSMLY